MALPFVKIWQTEDYKLVLQLRPPTEWGGERESKVYLVLDVEQRSFGWRILSEKPGGLVPRHAFIERLRKHMKSGAILEFFALSDAGYLLKIGASGQIWALYLRHDRPPYFDFADASTSLLRWGQKGTFTKKQSLHGDPSRGEDQMSKVQTLIQSLEHSAAEDSNGDEIFADLLSNEQRQLAGRLRRKLKTLKKSLQREEQLLPTPQELDHLQHCATFLKQYAYLVKPEQYELELGTEYTGLAHKLTITIDPEKNLGQNLEGFYTQLKKRKRALELGGQRVAKLRRECLDLESVLQRLKLDAISQSELQTISQHYKVAAPKPVTASSQHSDQRKPFKTYLLPNGWKILLGRGPKENDELTKQAKGNDTWVHTVAVPGAHAIIPRNGQPMKGSPPTDVIKAAAILSIHASRLRNDMAGEVYVTEKNNIRKKKGLAPGLWLVERSDTLFVRYSNEELQLILNCLQV